MLSKLTREVDNCLAVLKSMDELTWRYDEREKI